MGMWDESEVIQKRNGEKEKRKRKNDKITRDMSNAIDEIVQKKSKKLRTVQKSLQYNNEIISRSQKITLNCNKCWRKKKRNQNWRNRKKKHTD